MHEPAYPSPTEHRWPVAIALLGVVVILAFLPGRVRLVPAWAPFAVGSALIFPMVWVRLGHAKERWLRIEHITTLLFVAVIEGGTLATLGSVVHMMLFSSEELGGLQLLTSSIAVWINNVLAFSLHVREHPQGPPG